MRGNTLSCSYVLYVFFLVCALCYVIGLLLVLLCVVNFLGDILSGHCGIVNAAGAGKGTEREECEARGPNPFSFFRTYFGHKSKVGFVLGHFKSRNDMAEGQYTT